jgi:hypothetical protein
LLRIRLRSGINSRRRPVDQVVDMVQSLNVRAEHWVDLADQALIRSGFPTFLSGEHSVPFSGEWAVPRKSYPRMSAAG